MRVLALAFVKAAVHLVVGVVPLRLGVVPLVEGWVVGKDEVEGLFVNQDVQDASAHAEGKAHDEHSSKANVRLDNQYEEDAE